MRCPECLTLNPPGARFCMECGNRLLICMHCQTVNPPQAKYCIQCGAALIHQDRHRTSPLPESRSPGPPVWPEAGLLPRTTSHLSAPQERRIVTVIFADITGSTPLADRLDPEDLRAVLTGYFNLMTEQIRRHAGTVEKYIGDAVMAVFGAPVAHEDDPARAIRAALDMQRALNNFNTLRQARDPEAACLQMRIGINTGEVAGPGAQANRQDFLITGDAVNVAARLQQVALPDTILVGERTYLATRELFAFQPLAPLQVKGKEHPLDTWLVQGLSTRPLPVIQRPRGIESLQAPLVGRTLELTLMHATYARVRDARRSHLITLLGAPGVGKTRLAREFLARELTAARRTTCDETPVEPRVLAGHCPPYGEGITYWPLVEMLRALIGGSSQEQGEELERRFVEFVRTVLRRAKRSEDVDQVAEVLLQGIGRGLRGDSRSDARPELGRSTLNKDTDKGGPQAAFQRACRILFEALARLQPVILVIDDLQWADGALLELLEYLAGRLGDAPLLFLCLARPDFLERRHQWGGGQPDITTIILDALSREETAELITTLLCTLDVPDVLIHTIQHRAEGNPFFVEEIVRMLIDQQVLVKAEERWQISPQSEEALGDLASPATPPEDTLINVHYQLPLRIPDTIQGVLAARVDLLGLVEKQVLQVASIIGRTFWVSAVLELADGLTTEEVAQTLRRLQQRDLLEEGMLRTEGPLAYEERFSFKHILIRDVIYNNIPRVRRSQKHARFALWLESRLAGRLEDVVELLAYHYRQALSNWSATRYAHAITATSGEIAFEQEGLLSPLGGPELVERTLRYLSMAGDKAYQRYHTISAIQTYSEALELLQTNEASPLTLARMYQKLGHAYAQRADADQAWHAYQQALTLIKGQPGVARQEILGLYMHIAELATRWLGWFRNWLDMQEVRAAIDAGLKLVEGQPPGAEQSSFFTYQAMWYIRQLKYVIPDERSSLADQALHSGQRALRIAEEINDTDALWIALDALGLLYQIQQRYMQAHATQHRRQTLQALIHGREEMYDLYMALGWTHERISEYPAAALWCGRAWHIAQRMESPSMLLSSMQGRLTIWYEWERWREAREAADRMLQTSEQYQQAEDWQLFPLEILAELTYRMGEEEESERFLRQYRRIFAHYTTRPLLLPGVYAARGEWALALADLRAEVYQAEPFPSPAAVAQLAELSVLAGEPLTEQEAACERALMLAEQAGARKFLAVALRARGRMYGAQQLWDAAEQDLRRALETFQSLDLPWEQGQTLYCLGRLQHHQAVVLSPELSAVRAGKHGLARLFFEKAQGFFASLHAVHAVRQVDEALQESRRAAI